MTAPSGKPTRVDALLGKETDEEWAGRLEKAVVDVLSLDQWEAQKSRLRRTTIGGRELAVSLDRGIQLQDGDILLWDEPANTVVVARINLKDVLEIDLSALVDVTPEKMIQTCLELGHAVGNQHWPAVVKGMKVYVPLTVDKAVMGSVMRTHAFEASSTPSSGRRGHSLHRSTRGTPFVRWRPRVRARGIPMTPLL